MDIYAQTILDRYKHPVHGGDLAGADFSHEEANHTCGDKVVAAVKLTDGKIAEYRFKGEGCAISMAAADLLGDLVTGKTPEEVLAIKKEDVYEALGIEISLRRAKCALLALLAIHNALLQRSGKGRSWKDYL